MEGSPKWSTLRFPTTKSRSSSRQDSSQVRELTHRLMFFLRSPRHRWMLKWTNLKFPKANQMLSSSMRLWTRNLSISPMISLTVHSRDPSFLLLLEDGPRGKSRGSNNNINRDHTVSHLLIPPTYKTSKKMVNRKNKNSSTSWNGSHYGGEFYDLVLYLRVNLQQQQQLSFVTSWYSFSPQDCLIVLFIILFFNFRDSLKNSLFFACTFFCILFVRSSLLHLEM
jgi:hypothetical protein